MKFRTLHITFLVITSLFISVSCHKPYYIQAHTEHLYKVDKNAKPDTAFVSMLHNYKVGVDTQMQVIIGRTDTTLTKGQPECTLGNFMADAMLIAAKKIDPATEAAIANQGGIRLTYINAGPITRGKMYELMPFDNMLTIAEIPGTVLHQFCDGIATVKGWPVSNIHFIIKDKKAINIIVNGQPLDEHHTYKIAINDYMARGGDNCDFLNPLPKKFTTVFVRDALIDYVADLANQNKPLHPYLEKRIANAE